MYIWLTSFLFFLHVCMYRRKIQTAWERQPTTAAARRLPQHTHFPAPSVHTLRLDSTRPLPHMMNLPWCRACGGVGCGQGQGRDATKQQSNGCRGITNKGHRWVSRRLLFLFLITYFLQPRFGFHTKNYTRHISSFFCRIKKWDRMANVRVLKRVFSRKFWTQYW